MSTRFIIELNTDRFHDWPEDVQKMFHAVRDPEHYDQAGHFAGIKKLWERHHSGPCPVEDYIKRHYPEIEQ